MVKKVAIFIHGWGASSNVWRRPRGEAPLKRLFESPRYEYEVDLLDMPGKYLVPKKDFYYYAKYLAEKVEERAFTRTIIPHCPTCGKPMKEKAYTRLGADEITLVCHSMGGVAARLYLKDPKIGDPKAKKKVKRVITFASPHHGTEVPMLKLAKLLGPLLDVRIDAILTGIDACYRQAKVASPFLRKLNTPPECTPNAEYHCLWQKGDLIVAPTHTAILHGAKNYYIDNIGVRHINILWSVYARRFVRDILDGEPKPGGLQTYPSTSGCSRGPHHSWFPEPGLIREFLWRCRNRHGKETCNAKEIGSWRPGLKGCKVGKLDPELYWHTWRKTGRKNYKCRKCGRRVERTTSKPTATRSPKCNRWPYPNRHRWLIETQEWRCQNKGCGTVTWSRWRPGVLSCSAGKREERYHSWHRAQKRYQYRFKCAACGTRVGHAD